MNDQQIEPRPTPTDPLADTLDFLWRLWVVLGCAALVLAALYHRQTPWVGTFLSAVAFPFAAWLSGLWGLFLLFLVARLHRRDGR